MSRSKRHSRYPDKTYYTVAGWMKRLGLDRAARDIFAWIWSFAVQEMWNLASTSEYAAYLDMSEPTARNGLRKLTAMGLIVREVYDGDYGPAHKYTVPAEVVTAISQSVAAGDEWGITTLPLKEDKGANDYTPTTNGSLPHTSGSPIYKKNKTNNKTEEGAGADAPAPVAAAENPLPVELPVQADEESTDGQLFADLEPSSTKNHTPRKEKSSAKKEKSSAEFGKDNWLPAIAALGVTEATAAAWIKMRAGKTNKWSRHAFHDVEIGIAKAQADGRSPEEFIYFMLYHEWYGCNYQYVFDRLKAAQPEELRNMSVEEAVAAYKATPVVRQTMPRPAPAPVDNLDNIKQRSAELSSALGDMFTKNL